MSINYNTPWGATCWATGSCGSGRRKFCLIDKYTHLQFLPSYAILRSIPNKLLGVLALFASVLVLLILPQINTSSLRSSVYRPLHQIFFWLLVADFLLLGYIGQQTPESPFIEIGQIASIYYFTYFLAIIPLLGQLENKLIETKK